MPYLTTGERIGYKRGREDGRKKEREEGREEGRKEGREEGREEGRKEGEQELILHLLLRRFGELSPQVHARVKSMNSIQLEALGEALFDFTSIDDLNNWLQEH